MADANHPRDQIQRVTITESTWTEITIDRACVAVSVRQDPVEATQEKVEVKHRTDGAEPIDAFAAGEIWQKGVLNANVNPANGFQIGDTVGFFQRGSGTGDLVLIVRQHEV